MLSGNMQDNGLQSLFTNITTKINCYYCYASRTLLFKLNYGENMSIDKNLVRKIAKLSRISVSEDDVKDLSEELSKILEWIEQLSQVNTNEVEPIFSSFEEDAELKKRKDEIVDGGYRENIIANAPKTKEGFFLVPKIID